MRIKVGDVVYDPNDTPIMVILTDADKFNISHMAPEATKYAAFPSAMLTQEAEQWMADCINKKPDNFHMVIIDIKDERNRQDKKWGTHRKMSDFSWLAVIVEEVGEVARAILQGKNNIDIAKELIQVAAVAVAWLECILEFGETRQENSDFKNG